MQKTSNQSVKEVDFVREVLDLSPFGAFQADPEGNCFFINRRLEDVYGLNMEECRGRGWMSVVFEEDIPYVKAIIQEMMGEKKTAFEYTHRIHHRIKGLRWCKIYARFFFNEEGLPLYYFGFVEDTTDKILQEQALEEANGRLQRSDGELLQAKEQLERTISLLDASQEISQTGGWEYDVKTDTVFRTRQMKLMLGIASDTSLATATSFYEEEDDKAIQKGMKAAIEQHKEYDLELRPKGTKKWFRTIGRPVVKDGKVELVRGAVTDITDRKQTELELIHARNMAEDLAKTKTDFLSVMSHEIRTPLNGIIGIANLLKLNYTLDQEEYVTNLIFCADHLLQLINDILDLTKMESEKLELVCAEVNLFHLIRNIKNQFKSLAETKNIRLKSFIDDEIPTGILADPIRLGQILNNLVSNALKFTDEGEVTLLVKLVSADKEKAIIHFSIKDTGIGIPEHLQETIFESFKQVQQSAYRKHSGTGLGLTITKKLIELHNSRLYIKSSPGVGTEFYFELSFELANDKNSPARFVATPALSGYEKKLNGIRLLFVEDNPINVLVAKKQLEYFGVVPDCAHSGKEALIFLENNEYDAALLDLHMPEIDGYALAEIIRRQYPGIHIIIFTADIMTEVKVKLAKMNIYDILNKPFAPERMFEILSKLTPGGQASSNSPRE